MAEKPDPTPGDASAPQPTAPTRPRGPHLWEHQWVRDLLVLLAVALLVWAIFAARAVVVPVAVGLALAYVFNPLVAWAQRWGVPRWAGTVSIILICVLALGGLGLYLVPKAIVQATELVERVPEQARRIADAYGFEWEEALMQLRAAMRRMLLSSLGITDPPPDGDDPAPPPDDDQANDAAGASPDGARAPPQGGGPGAAQVPPIPYGQLAETGWVVGQWVARTVGSIVAFSFYLFLFILVAGLCFFYFSSHFDRLSGWVEPYLPAGHRVRIWRILDRMDTAVSAWLRGRLLQCLVIAVLFSVGWWLVGTPYWLLLGLLGGVLNLIPYAASVMWPLSVGLTWINAAAGGNSDYSIAWVIIGPSLAYIVAQLVDNLVMEPLVQGRATELNWLAVLVAVLIGGSLFGFLGLLLAIPVTACIKILLQELVLPRLRQYAGEAV